MSPGSAPPILDQVVPFGCKLRPFNAVPAENGPSLVFFRVAAGDARSLQILLIF